MDHQSRKPKQPHPRQKANILSILTFIYMIPLFRKGSKQTLNEDDLYEVLPNYESKRLGDQLENEWIKNTRKHGKASIVRVIYACFGWDIFWLGIASLTAGIVNILVQPYALAKVISYFNPDQKDMSKSDLYLHTGLLILVNLLLCVYHHNFYLGTATVGFKIQAAFASLIYRKALRLNSSHTNKVSAGKIVTLLTKDINCVQYFSFLINDIWISIAKAIVTFCVIYRKIQVAAFAGIAFYLIVLPLQVCLGTWAIKLRTRMCTKIDERLQTIREALSAIKVIKMYSWEKIFTDRITKSRKQEIKSMYAVYYLRITIMQIGALSGNVAFYFLIMSYKWFGNHVSAEIVYYIDSCFQVLSFALGAQFASSIILIAEVVASIRRVTSFLELPEMEAYLHTCPGEAKVIFENVDINFDKNVLKSINLTIDRGITFITGPVASGKSTLLKMMLQEYEPRKGTIVTQGKISYASQNPWLFPSSIKQNILFGEDFDDLRYGKVLNVCALKYDLNLLPDKDGTIVEDHGINLSKGQQARINLARAVYKRADIYLLDDCLSALDYQVSDYIFEECLKKFLQDKVVIFVSHNSRYIKRADSVLMVEGGNVTSVKLSEVLEKSEETKDITEDLHLENHVPRTDLRQRKIYQEFSRKGEVKLEVYKKYMHFGGGLISLVSVLFFCGISQFAYSYPDKLLSEWYRVNLEQKLSNFTAHNETEITQEVKETVATRDYKLRVYTTMTLSATFLVVVSTLVYYKVTKKASLNLHKHMITNIINATMHFFDSTFIGNILNRFSLDFNVIDDHLPFMLNNVIWMIFIMIGNTVLIATVNTYFLLPSLVLCMLLVISRRYYLKTSRSLKRLEMSTRSPMIGHFNSSLEGLLTVRAFKAQSILINEFDRHQNLYTSAIYTFQCSMKSFAFYLDILCNVFVAIILGRFVISGDDFLSGSVGLAISQALKMGGIFQWGIQMWAETENSMTSVERALEYGEVQQENKKGQVLQNWPNKGEIQYSDVSLSYNKSNEYVLKGMNFLATSKEKIGVIGRTGAGKSSIISTFFRLYEAEGKITIDGVDTKSLSLDFVRRHISIIPQDPVLFRGSIRDNIDPERLYSDDQIWEAIKASNLTNCVPSLNHVVAENGSNFSVGQKQLVCLARAIVRKNKIVILDEVTANMDDETDALIHETIKKQFEDCTVIMVAHKLHSVINLDKIVVMEKGRIVDFDSPSNLLKRRNGYFYRTVKNSELLS